MMKPIINRIIIAILSYQLTFMPMRLMAAPIVDPTAPIAFQPSLTTSSSAVPVVNITTPTASGTSRNQFHSFDVDASGVILNNSTSFGTAILGGTVPGNPNLTNRTAAVIVNEVTGNSASVLEGQTEVFGDSASVVLANPYGVTCNGCGFINTPRVSLTTGTPSYDQAGDLQSIAVNRGALVIGPAGLAATNQEQMDLIAKQIILNGYITVNDLLHIQAGDSSYDYDSGQTTSHSGSSDAIAIDATTLGAMEAGRIAIISTDAGAGVKLDANVVSNVNDITIDAQGNIQLGSAASQTTGRQSVLSQGNLTITTTGTLTKHSQSYSSNDSTIEANTIENTGRIEADGDLNITTTGDYTNTGKLDAAVDMVLITGGLTFNSGFVDVGGNLNIQASDTFTNDNVKIIAMGTLDFQGGGDLHNHNSDMYAAGGITVSAQNMEHSGVSYLGSDGTLTIDVENDVYNLDIDSLIQSQSLLTITGGGLLDNRLGSIVSNDHIAISMGSLVNDQGLIATLGDSNNNLTMTISDGVSNIEGIINSKGALSIEATNFDNRFGETVSETDLAITSTTIDNSAGIIHSNDDLSMIAYRSINNLEGTISAQEELTIQTAGSLLNESGVVTSSGSLYIDANMIDSFYGSMTSAGAIQIDADTIDNTFGTIIAGDSLVIESNELINLVGQVYGETSVTLTTNNLDTSLLDNTGGEIFSNGAITISQGSLDNRYGYITSNLNDVTISVSGTLSNDGGRVESSGNTIIIADQLDNQGNIIALADMSITAEAIDNSYGVLYAGQTLAVTNDGDIINDHGNFLAAGSVTILAGGALDNARGNISSSDRLTLQVESISSNQHGYFRSTGDMELTVSGLLDSAVGSILTTDGALTIAANQLKNDAGLLQASENITITTSGADSTDQASFSSHGGNVIAGTRDTNAILTTGHILINSAGSIVGDLALFQSTGGLVLEAVEDMTAQGAIFTANDNIILVNDAELADQEALLTLDAISLQQQLEDAASLTTGRAGSITISGASLNSPDTIRIRSADALLLGRYTVGTASFDAEVIAEDVQLDAGGDVDLSYAYLADQQGLAIHSGGNLTLAGDGVQSNLVSLGDITLDATHISSNAATIFTNQDITLTADSISGQDSVLKGDYVTMTTTGGLVNPGLVIEASTAANLTAGGALDLDDSIIQSTTIDLTSGGTLYADHARFGMQTINGNLAILADHIDITANDIAATGLTALSNQHLSVTALGGNVILDESVLYSNEGMSIQSQGDISYSSGFIKGIDGVTLTAQTGITTSNTQILANEAVSIQTTSGDFTNIGDKGLIQTALDTGTINVVADGVRSLEGNIHANEKIVFQANQGDLILGGNVTTNNDLTLTNNSGSIVNQDGTFIVLGDLDVTTSEHLVNIDGDIQVQEAFTLTALTGSFLNEGGSLYATNGISITTQTVDNENGSIQSGDAVDITTTTGSINNENGGLIQAIGGTLTLDAAGSIFNQGGTIASNSSVSLTADQQIDNQNGGVIDAALAIYLATTHDELLNQGGLIEAGSDLTLDILSGNNTSGGQMIAGGNIDVTISAPSTASNNFANGNGGLIQAVGNITVNSAGRIGNAGGTYVAGGNIHLTATTNIRNMEGTIQSTSGNITLNSGGSIINDDGTIASATGITMSTGTTQDALYDQVIITAGGQTASHGLTNRRGTITSQGTITATTTHFDSHNGTIISNQDINITANNSSSFMYGINLAGGGTTHADGNINLTTTDNVWADRGSTTEAGQNIIINMGETLVTSQGGTLAANGNISIHSTQGHVYNESGGLIQAGDLLTVTLDETIDNPLYPAYLAALAQYNTELSNYNDCVADPTCVAGDAPTPPEEEPALIRGSIFNGGGTIEAQQAIFNIHNLVNHITIQNGSITDQTLTNLAALQGLTNSNGQSSQLVAKTIVAAGAEANTTMSSALTQVDSGEGTTGTMGSHYQGVYQRQEVFSKAYRADHVDARSIKGNYHGNDFVSSSSNGQSSQSGFATATGNGIISTQMGSMILQDPQVMQQAANEAAFIRYISSIPDTDFIGGQVLVDNLTINANGTIDNRGGSIVSSIALNLYADNIINDTLILADGTVINSSLSGGDVTLVANANISNRGGTIDAEGNLLLSAENVFNERVYDDNGNLLEGGSITGNLTTILANNQLSNIGGEIYGANQLLINAGSITNSSLYDSNHQLVSLANIHGGNQVMLQASGAITNTAGRIASGNTLAISASSLVNERRDMVTLALANGDQTMFETSNAAMIWSGGNMQLDVTNTLNDASTITAGGSLVVNGHSFVNRSRQLVNRESITSDTIQTDVTHSLASVSAGNGMSQLTLSGDLDNSGDITSIGNLLITAQNVINQEATDYSYTSTVVDGQSALTDYQKSDTIHGQITAAQLEINAIDTVTNSGLLHGDDSLRISAQNITNDATIETIYSQAQVAALGDLAPAAGPVVSQDIIANMGSMTSGGDVTLIASNTLSNRGDITAGGTLGVLANYIDNEAVVGTTTIQTTDQLVSDVETVMNTYNIDSVYQLRSYMDADHSTTTTSQQILGGGNMSGSNLEIVANSQFTNRGNISGEGFVSAGNILNESIILEESTTNTATWGSIYGQQERNAEEIIHHVATGTGIITGENVMVIASDTITNRGTIAGNQNTTIIAGNFINEAQVTVDKAALGIINGEHMTKVRDQEIVQGETGRVLGETVSILTSHDITNIGGSINSTGDTMLLAGATINGDGSIGYSGEGTISNQAIKRTLTDRNHKHPIIYEPGVIAAGGSVTLIAGDSIENIGSTIGAVEDVNLFAKNNITSMADGDTWVWKNKKGTFSSSYHEAAVNQPAVIMSNAGSVNLYTDAGDITLQGTHMDAGLVGEGNIVMDAGRDVLLDAFVTEEIHRRSKIGFSGLSVGKSDAKWNDHNVVLTTLTADSISINADRDISGEGALFFAEEDITMHADRFNTLDSEKVTKYLNEKGWSISLNVSTLGGLVNSNAANAAINGDGFADVRDAVITGNPTASAIDGLRNVDGGLGLLNLGNAGIEAYRLSQAASPMGAAFGGSSVSVRFGVHESSTQWTESYLTQLNAGGMVQLTAGNEVQLLGGTQINAGNGIRIHGEHGVQIAANEDMYHSDSSGYGFTVGTNGVSPTFGIDGNRYNSNGKTYTNAYLGGGAGDVVITSGDEINIIGANIEGQHVDINGAGIVTIASVQNSFQSENSGFSMNVGANGSFSGSVTDGYTDRLFADNQTSIIGSESVSVSSGTGLNLLGAVVANLDENGVDQGNLLIETPVLNFSDMTDTDDIRQATIGINLAGEGGVTTTGQQTGSDLFNQTASLDYQYQDVDGITRATVGEGTIIITDPENQVQDLANLNRNVGVAQEVSRHESASVSITVPIPEGVANPMRGGVDAVVNTVVNIVKNPTGMDIDTGNHIHPKQLEAALNSEMGQSLEEGDSVTINVQDKEVLTLTLVNGQYVDQDGNPYAMRGEDGSYEVAGAGLIAFAVAASGAGVYTAIVGDGDVIEGLEVIGKGDDPLSVAVASGVETAVELSYETFPEATQATLNVLVTAGELMTATVTYIDDNTGQVVSRSWNALDESTRNRLIGGGKVLSVVLPAASVGKITQLTKVNTPDAEFPNNLPNGNLSPSAGGITATQQVVRSADEVNTSFDDNIQPPYLPGTTVTEFVTTKSQTFVRVHASGNSVGHWIMRESDIQGLTPEQIQAKFSLPQVPTLITDVNIPAGTSMRVGQVNDIFGGDAGATQYQILTDSLPPNNWFSNIRILQ